jgi:hypothetical protein
VDLVRGQPRFRYTLLSPEISKQDMGQATTALKTFTEAWAQLHAQQLFTEDSLAAGTQKMAKELLDIELELIPEQERIEVQTQKMLPESPTEEGEDDTEKNFT